MKRTDIHRPSAIRPSEYEYVAMEHQRIDGMGDVYAVLYNRELIKKHMERTGGHYATHEHGGNCSVCGADAIYTILWYHAPTNTYIRTGQDCAQKMDMSYDEGAYNAFRRAITDAREAQAGKRKAQALLADAGLTAAWDVYAAGFIACPAPEGCKWGEGFITQIDGSPCTPAQEATYRDAYWEHTRRYKPETTIYDIVGKLVKYGSISEAATKYLGTLLNQIAERPAREAARAAETAAAANCPTGRVEIEGLVLSLKVDENQFGTVTKILVKHDTGYKVWGSRPAVQGARCIEVGDRVAFKARVEPSAKDPKFGFYSRPTGGKIVVAKEGV